MLLEYRLESVLGAGAFGMTYLARDTHLEKHVAIKEYLPTELAVRALDGSVVPITTEHEYNYQWGRDRFLLEARTLARFSHPNIVRVNRYFEANSTGYMVMDYEKGESLFQLLRRAPQPPEARLREIVMPLLDGLHAVHEAGFLHRDIKPSNVFIRESGIPVLLDFGAARQAIGGATKSLTSVLTPGYAPLEQYSSDGNQGPWSDVYALAGVVYRALVNENPPDAVSRMRSDVVPDKLAAARGRAGPALIDAVAWALNLDEKRRPQSAREWQRALRRETTVPGAPAAADLPATVRLDSPTAPLTRAESLVPETRRSGLPWGWVGLVAVLLAVIVGLAVWTKQRQPEKTAHAPVAPPEAPADKPKFRPKPAGVTDQSASAPERPPRERGARPGSDAPESEQTRRQVAEEFRGADVNGDGFLTPDETRRFPFIAKEFQRVDSDGDGRISLQEFAQLRRQQAQQRLQK